MKTVISTFSKIAIVLVAIFTMSFSQTTGTPGMKDPAELLYVGSINNQPQFKLNLNNSESDEFVITIRNKNNDVIYKETLKGANISRNYRLNTEEPNSTGVTFEVVSKKNKTRLAYTVNETSRLVQEVSITAQ